MIESFTPEILRFKDDTLSQYLKFDFGKYTIPESFFKHSSAFDAAEELFSSDYAIVASYMEDQSYRLVQLLVKDKSSEEGHSQYGLYNGKEWKWFSLRDYEPEPASSPFKGFYNNVLYCLFEPEMIMKMESRLGKSILNRDILKEITPESEYVIAKICFN